MTDEVRERYQQRLRMLTAFKHRGSATDYERRAADALIVELNDLGIAAVREDFRGSRSSGGRILIHVVVAFVGLICLWSFPVATIALGGAALASLLTEQTTHGAWLSWPLVRAASSNVVARLPAEGATRRRIVVCGHYDTQRTGFIWNVHEWLRELHWRLPVALKSPLLPLAAVMFAQMFMGVAALWGVHPILNAAGWGALAVYAAFGALLGQCAVGQFVPGAGDNASGAAGVVTLGEAWLREPIVGVELTLLLTGSEETVLLGAAAWADRHRAEIHAAPTLFLNLDGIGCGPPRFLGWDTPAVGLPIAYPRTLIATAATVAAEQGLTDPGPHSLPGPTDGLAFLTRGIPGMTIVGFQGHGRLPHYHQISDTFDAVDLDAAWAGVEFAWALLRRLAQEADEASAPSP